MKKLKLKLSFIDSRLLLQAMQNIHCITDPSYKKPAPHWSELVAGHVARELYVRIERALVIEQTIYSFKLNYAEALVVRQAMLILTAPDVQLEPYRRATYSTILTTIDQALV